MERQLRDDKQWVAACLKLATLGSLKQRDKLRLLQHYPHPAAIFEAPLAELSELLQIRIRFLQEVLASSAPDTIARQAKLIDERDIEIILYNSAAYPPMLSQIQGAPPVLFIQGNSTLLSGPQIAMVGSRHASPSGLKTARAFAAEFAASGLTITSGLASGIDTAAHRGALNHSGSTIAIVATGLDEVYPRGNAKLARFIIEEGCIVSEFPPLTPARRAHFPQRNRIISGISLGTVIVEATLRSGSLITARLAAEQNREVFAVPGSIHSFKSTGTHTLIKQGAKLVENSNDILEELQLNSNVPPDKKKSAEKNANVHLSLSFAEQHVLASLDHYPAHIDDIAHKLDRETGELLGILLQLELKGVVKQSSGKFFFINPESEHP